MPSRSALIQLQSISRQVCTAGCTLRSAGIHAAFENNGLISNLVITGSDVRNPTGDPVVFAALGLMS
jgi:hypothetical protein